MRFFYRRSLFYSTKWQECLRFITFDRSIIRYNNKNQKENDLSNSITLLMGLRTRDLPIHFFKEEDTR